MAVHTPLLRPNEYYDRYDRPSLWVGFGAFVLFLLLEITFRSWAVSRFVDKLGGRSIVSDRLVQTEVLSAFLGVIVIDLLVVTLLVYGGLRLQGGEGGPLTTLAVVGESFLARIAVYPLHIWGILGILDRMPADADQADTVLHGIGINQPPAVLAAIAIMTVWIILIQTVGLSKGHELPVTRVGVVVTITASLNSLIVLLT